MSSFHVYTVSRPSETVVGESDSPSSGASSGNKRSVEFHSIPPVSTVDGVYDKSRFSSLPIASSPARDLKTALIIRTNRPPHPIDADVIIKPDLNSLSNISLYENH